MSQRNVNDSFPRVTATFIPELNKFRLDKALVTDEITVPVGFLSDGISSPWWARWYVSRVGRSFAAAFVHDYCLEQGINSLIWANRLFYINCGRLNEKPFKRKVMYLAVKLGAKGNY